MTRRGKVVLSTATAAIAAVGLWSWADSGHEVKADAPAATAPATAPSTTPPTAPAAGPPAAKPTDDGRIPGLGDAARKRIPAGSRQVLVVTGKGADSSDSTAVLYTRDEGSRIWRPGPSWPAHNAAHGWTPDHHYGDLRSPEGVFTLTGAGGKLAFPDAKLPYDHNGSFIASGSGVEGEPLAGAFDYVIGIDYNRVPGTSPLDPRRPLGAKKGGGVWLHVDHDGPTQGCVSLKPKVMRTLLRTLDPKLEPVVVMGPASARNHR
ncbi:L,D-transpeptidase family protein [Streptomyces sp. NPDC057654]|uniref:L,D-transpeptidase family protein n=1 Tax=Streptomyces sp. NPDC057654 TaxID=3346196 RepID=UPI0036C89C51